MPSTAGSSGAADSLPPPSFSLLVMSLGSQAMIALGQTPSPLDGKTEVRLEFAKHAIDMLAILEQKTTGNLAADEAQLLESVQHQLRLTYLDAVAKKS